MHYFSYLIMFSFLSLNARSLLNKMDELAHVATSQSPPSIIAVCETWCQPSEPDSLYSLDGFTLYRCDRKHSRGGGTALYINDSLKHKHLTDSDFNMEAFESTWLEVDTGSSTLVIGCTYRPPNSNPSQFYYQLEKCLHTALSPSANLLLLGDFNSKHQTWLHSDTTDVAGDCLSGLLDTLGLYQLSSFPTCNTRGSMKSCLDLVITNLEPYTVKLNQEPPLGNSDHISIRGTWQQPRQDTASHPAPPTARAWRWCWDSERVDSLKQHLAQTDLLPPDPAGVPCDTLWTYWRAKVLRVAHLYCTSLQPCSNRPRSQPRAGSLKPWMSPELLQEIRLKHRCFREYLKSRTPDAWTAFTAQRNHVTALLRSAKSEFVMKSSESSAGGSIAPPRLHTLMRCLTKERKKVIPSLNHEQSVLSDPLEKATALNSFFISQSKQSVEGADRQPVPRIQYPTVTDNELTSLSATETQVANLLKGLDTTKSAGHDGIPTRLLKEAADCLAPSLTVLFNTSFKQCSVPQDWRDATITPAFKKGNPASLTNYRPISLLSIISKIQERIVYEQLYEHINPHLPPHQSGFRSNDGTELQLSRLIHHITAARDSGQTVLACFFDLSKAFDRVWHRGLLAKLSHLGVRGNAHQWLSSYLCHRRQRVKVDGQFSDWLEIPAGVPQGSVLGPLLFLAYTVDLPTACTTPLTICSQFADDTALVTSSESFVSAEADLQKAVTAAGDWLTSWHLLVNATKTVVLSFHHPNRPPSRKPAISLHQTALSVVTQHKHLGLIIQSNLRWNIYLNHVISKSLRKLHLLHRIRGSINSSALCFLYKTYIRPVFEYASLAYSHLPSALSDKLERVQRKAARVCLRIPLFEPVHHSSLLHSLCLPTIYSRRLVKLALLGHSLYYQYAPPHLLAISPHIQSEPRYSLRHSRIFALPKARTDRYRDSPINLALHAFNNLPAEYTNIRSKSLFKSKVEPFLLSSICCCTSHSSLH